MVVNQNKTVKYPGLLDLLFASIIYGMIPLIAVLSGGRNNPLLYLGLLSLGGVCGSSIYLFFYHKYIYKDNNWKKIISLFFNLRPLWGSKSIPTQKVPSVFNVFRERSILLRISSLGTFLFAWSLVYVHTIIAAVIIESWPILLIFLLKKIAGNKYNFTKRALFLNAIAFLAVILVVFSNSSEEDSSIAFNGGYIFGLLLLAFALIFSLQTGVRNIQGQKFARETTSISSYAEKGFEQENLGSGVVVFLRLLASFVGMVAGFVFFAIFEIFNIFQNFSGTLSIGGMIIAFVGGSILSSIGVFTNARGTIKGKDLKVQAIRYLTPVFGIFFLAILIPLRNVFTSLKSQIPAISDINWSWFIAGFLGILSANVVVNFKSEEKKFGLTSLVVSLWLSGILVFFRDEWSWWLDNINLLSTGSLEYYGFLGSASTIFALLISFEISRLEQRTTREEGIVFSLLKRLEVLYPTEKEQSLSLVVVAEAKDNSSKPETENILECLESLDRATNVETIRRAYESIENKLASEIKPDEKNKKFDSGYFNNTNERMTYCQDTSTELNELTHSKQYGRRVSGSIAIILLAVFTATLAISLRPAGEAITNLPAVLIDIFAFLLAATVAYLTFHLFDLHANRRNSIIEIKINEKGETTGRYHVEFQEPGFRSEASIATVLVATIVVTYVVLYCLKWLA